MPETMEEMLRRRRNRGGVVVAPPSDPAAYRPFSLDAFPNLFPSDDEEDLAVPAELYPRDSSGAIRPLAISNSAMQRRQRSAEEQAAAEAELDAASEGMTAAQRAVLARRQSRNALPGTGRRFQDSGGVPYIDTAEGPVAMQNLRGARFGLPSEPGQPFTVLEVPDGVSTVGGRLPVVPLGESAPGVTGNQGGSAEPRTFGQVAGDAGLWAARQVGSALEPLTLLQDVFFATTADIANSMTDRRLQFNGRPVQDHEVDSIISRLRSGQLSGTLTLPDGTPVNSFEALDYLDGQSGGMWQNLSEIEWLKYAPGGAAPTRPVSGAELLETLGVEGEPAQKWGGIAMDFLADPLLLGAAFRVTGRALNAASRLGADDVARALPADASRVGTWADDARTVAQRRVDDEALRFRDRARDLEREIGWESFSPDAAPAGRSPFVPRVVDDVVPDSAQVRRAGESAAATARASSGVGDPLIRLGNAVDNAMSIGGVARAAWHGNNATAAAARGFVERRLETAWSAIQGNDGLLAVAARNVVDWAATPRARANILLGRGAAEGTGIVEGGTARTFGEQTVLNRGLGRAHGDAVASASIEEAYTLMADVLGMRETGFMQRIFGALRGYPRTFRQVDDLPEAVRQTMLTQAFEVVDNSGVMRVGGTGPVRTGIAELDLDVAAVRGAITESAEEAAEAASRWDSLFHAAQRRVRSAAEASGIEDVAALARYEDRFTQLVEGLTRIDSRLGFETSGYGIARDRFIRGFMEESGAGFDDAAHAWQAVLTARLRDGADMNDINNMRIAISGSRTGNPFVAGTHIVDDVGILPSGAAVGDFIRQDTLFSHLDLNRFIDSLQDGHLRRSYAVWSDPGNLGSLESAFRSGRIAQNSLLADHVPQRVLQGRPDMLADFESYREVVGAGRDNFIIRQDSMIQHLAEQAMKRDVPRDRAFSEAQRAWNDVVTELNPHLGETLSNLHRRTTEYQSRFARQGGRQGYTAAFDQRTDISDEWLEQLGELRDPLVSILESSQAARRVVPLQDFMRNTYDAALASGHVVRRPPGSERFIDQATGVRYELIPESDRNVFGAFASRKGSYDMYVHPQLRREIESAFKSGNPTLATLNRMRSAIAGGYLASPNMAFVNLAGAVYSSTIGLDGANPIPLIRNMGVLAREMFSGDSPWFRKLNEFIPAGDLNQAHTTVLQRNLGSLKLESAGVGGMGVGAAVRHAADWYEGVLREPGGLRLAGLDGFQLIDQWVRTAAFKTHYERLRMGGRSGVAADAFDDATSLAEAAELARLSALDYSELPRVLTSLRDTGLVMFPGFPFLMVQRNIEAALNRPAGLALYDRAQDAITNAVVDPEERAAMYAGMDEWLKEAGGAPIVQYEDEDGNIQWQAIPIADIIPTRTRFGTPMMENIGGLGLYGPLWDILQAYTSGTGEAPLAGRYGQRVFGPIDEGADRLRGMSAFLYNSFAPAFARRLVAPGSAGTEARGLLPEASRTAQRAMGVELEPGMRDSILTYNEYTRQRADRGLAGEIIATFIRSPQTLTSSGQLASAQRTYDRAQREFNTWRQGATEAIRRALAMGDQVRVEELQTEYTRRVEEFRVEWSPLIEILRDSNERRRQRLESR